MNDTKLQSNHNYKQKFKYIKNDDKDKKFDVSITINCNHKVDENLLNDFIRIIESHIVINYLKEEEYEKREKEIKERMVNDEEYKMNNVSENKKMLTEEEKIRNKKIKNLKLKNLI